MKIALSQDHKYRVYTALDDISPQLIEAVLLYEDKQFYHHMGVNPLSLLTAFTQTYCINGAKRGASTITMQLARLRFSIDSSHIPGKLWQMARALHLELHYSKNEILEAYLNLVPYGGNIEGIGAASYIYLGAKASDLNLIDSLSLAVIPQNPTKRANLNGLIFQAGTKAHQARKILLTKWLKIHPEDRNYEQLFDLPLSFQSSKALPFIAPQFTLSALANTKGKKVFTTIDKDLQDSIEKQVQTYIKSGQRYGINNASVLLVDFTTMEVLASIGSADFFNYQINGQVDGNQAKRSPGSTLKPFIYALAFDQGLIHPLSLLKDVPHQHGQYLPENFDGEFIGPLSASQSLLKSRNAPVVSLASQLYKPNFYEFLKQIPISKMRKQDEYDLSIALGNVEVSMEELASLYAMLANLGVYSKVQKVFLGNPSNNLHNNNGAVTQGSRKLSREASYLTLDILKDTRRPKAYVNTAHQRGIGVPIYWKTGTSSAFRDSWTVGIFGKYVLAVWVGDFKGKVQGTYIGIKTAAPLFFNIIYMVTSQEYTKDLILSKANDLSLAKVRVCADTGDVENSLCPVQIDSWFIPGKSPIKPTGIYKKMLVNIADGTAACEFIEGLTEYKAVAAWPSDLLALYRAAGIHKAPAPLPIQACPEGMHRLPGQKPEITLPLKHVRYSIKDRTQLVFTATADGSTREIFWFVDDVFVGKTAPSEKLIWESKPGSFSLRAVDERGRADVQDLIIDQ